MGKKITKDTILRQGSKDFKAVEVDGIIYWFDESLIIKDVRPYVDKYHYEVGVAINRFPTYLTDLTECKLIIAQSTNKLGGIPVISLDSYVERLATVYSLNETKSKWGEVVRNAFRFGYKSNTNTYTQKDIEKAIELARKYPYIKKGEVKFDTSNEKILEQINQIQVIEVDEDFNIINNE